MPIEGRKATFQKKNHEVPRHVPKNAVDLQIQKSIIIRDLEALSKAKRKPMGSQRSTTVKRLGDILLDVKGISNSKVLQSEMISKDNAHRRQLKTTSVERKRDKIPNETPGFSKTLPLHERRAPSTAKKQKTYQQIRNEFEYASGGIDLHGDNKTHLKPKPTKHIGLGPRGDTRRDSLRWHDVDSKQRPRSDSPFDSPKPGAVGLPPKKPARLKPIGGIPLIGLREHIFNLSSEQVAKRPKNEQRDNKETISENKQHEGSDKSLRITYTRRHPTKPSTKLQGRDIKTESCFIRFYFSLRRKPYFM